MKSLRTDKLGALLSEHQNLAYSVCMQVLRHAQDAEDAAQEALLELVRYADRLGEIENLRGWMYRVSLNTALRHRARAHSRDRRQQVVGRKLSRGETEKKLADQVHEYMVLLDDEHRCALLEHYLERRTLKEMAEERGCSINAMWKRIAKGKNQLRKLLQDAGMGAVALASLDRFFEFLVPTEAPHTLLSHAFLKRVEVLAPKATATISGGITAGKFLACAVLLLAGGAILLITALFRGQPGEAVDGPGPIEPVASSAAPQPEIPEGASGKTPVPVEEAEKADGEEQTSDALLREISLESLNGVSGVTYDGAALWFGKVDPQGKHRVVLYQVDPARGVVNGRALREVPVDCSRLLSSSQSFYLNLVGVAVQWDGSKLWIAFRDLLPLLAVDPQTGNILHEAPPPCGNRPIDLAYGNGALWVLDTNKTGRTIHKLDPGNGLVLGSVTIPEQLQGSPPVSSMTFAKGNLWLWRGNRMSLGEPLVGMNPDAGALEGTIPTPEHEILGMCNDARGRLWFLANTRQLFLDGAPGSKIVSKVFLVDSAYAQSEVLKTED